MKGLPTRHIVIMFLLCILLGTASAQIGPELPLPIWAPCAQVRLGWVFADPKNPQDSIPLPGWEAHVSPDPPVWAYDSQRQFNGDPAQWYIQIPNINNDHPRKHLWLSYVYERDPEYIPDAPRAFTNIDWSPDAGWEPSVYPPIEWWYKSDGTFTTLSSEAVYASVTLEIDLLPNPQYEDIFIGVAGEYTGMPIEPIFGADGYDLVEVYLLTQCMPEPTVWTGLSETFTKLSYSDWELPENQDRITDNVWLTRADSMGLFNIRMEDNGFEEFSPICTEWAYGSAADWQSLDFQPWLMWHGAYPLAMVGQDAVLHLLCEEIYLDIKFLFWASGEGVGGGGFSYQRASPCAEYPASDSNHDCRVDLRDLALMAAEWLDCNLHDQQACGPN